MTGARKIDAMGAAETPAPEPLGPLSWAEICARYPDQYVCLVDVVREELGSPVIQMARVVGNGPTRGAAFEPFRSRCAEYSSHSVRFTGICTEPLIRPALVIDDELHAILFS